MGATNAQVVLKGIAYDDHGPVNRGIHPPGDGAVGDEGQVGLGPLQVCNDDEPRAAHREPAEDVRHHAPVHGGKR